MIILPEKYAHIRWDEEHAQDWVSETFTWTDRDSYLVWVATWKAELGNRIVAIRRAKAIRRDKTQTDEARGDAQSERQILRIECANLFLLRSMGKRLSATQRKTRLTHAA
jgi:hypothetical protein